MTPVLLTGVGWGGGWTAGRGVPAGQELRGALLFRLGARRPTSAQARAQHAHCSVLSPRGEELGI